MKLPLVLVSLIPVIVAGAQQLQHYQATTIVSSVGDAAGTVDPNLNGCRGLARLPGGPLWAADHANGVLTNYPTDGSQQRIVTVPAAVGSAKGTPTGLVAN